MGSHALALADQTKEKGSGADALVAELLRLPGREFEYLLGARGERDLSARCLLAMADHVLDFEARRLQRDAHGPQRLRRQTVSIVKQSEQDVLSADVAVVEHPGLFLSQDHDPPCAVGEVLEHDMPIVRPGLASWQQLRGPL